MIGMPLENCGSDVCPAWYSNRSSNCAGVIQNMPLIISPLPMTSRGCSARDKVVHRRGPPTGAAPSRGSVSVPAPAGSRTPGTACPAHAPVRRVAGRSRRRDRTARRCGGGRGAAQLGECLHLQDGVQSVGHPGGRAPMDPRASSSKDP